MADNFAKRLFQGFIYLHILHHAELEPVYGLWLIEELGHHGYKMSPGTLYPLLHRLESEGLLILQEKLVSGRVRKYYRCTQQGRATLQEGRRFLSELVNEIGLEADSNV